MRKAGLTVQALYGICIGDSGPSSLRKSMLFAPRACNAKKAFARHYIVVRSREWFDAGTMAHVCVCVGETRSTKAMVLMYAYVLSTRHV